MSFEEFQKNNKELKKITESLYSFSKKDIKQDDIVIPKNVEHLENPSFFNKLKTFFKTIYTYSKDTLYKCKLNKILYFIFSKLKALIVFIYYAIPAIILIYAVIQICLFISTNVLTLSSKFDKGWNDNFIKSLPIMFQPAKIKFGQFLTTFTTFYLGIFMIRRVRECGIYKWYIQLLLNTISILIISALYIMPEEIYRYVAIIFLILILICMFGRYVSAIFCFIFGERGDGGGGGGGGSSSSSSYDSYSNDSSSYESSYSEPETYDKTLKIMKVTQFGNTVQIKIGNYINGKYDGTGTGYNKIGQLLGYGDSFVRIKENDGWIRTYGVHGEITNTEKL